MTDYTVIGSSPCEEDCLSLGTPEYSHDAAIAECRRFRELIRQHCGMEPAGAQLIIKPQSHDFGTYHEVWCRYDEENELAADYAFHVEGCSPAKWDGTGATRWTMPEPAIA